MKTKMIMTLLTVGLIALVIIVSLTDHNDGDEFHFNTADIVFEEGVVNIYYFWGDGCPNCDAQSQFLESIEEEMGEYFNLYTFEVWFNEDNARLLGDIAEILNKNVTGIPFTIIGGQTFIGFNERMENNFINAIREGVNDEFDVFRDLVEQ